MHEIERGELRLPAWVVDIDVLCSYDEVVDVQRFATAWCLVRRDGAVVAARFLDIEDESHVALTQICDLFADSDLPQPLWASTLCDEDLTVVIPTNRPTELPRLLESLANQSDAAFSVLVVDNSPDIKVANSSVDTHGLNIRFCHEPTPGVSHARNHGLAEVTTDLVAWIDDDEIADPDWIAWIKRGFASPGRPEAIAGVMLPAELETAAQVNFERYGGFNKGRPMHPAELRAGTETVRDPLFPLPNFGAGGNMAFRTQALVSIGGFRSPLGTPRVGGEDTWVLAFILEAGGMILHWPPAVTWHHHRRTDAELARQFYSYSAGLTAFYAAVILTSPRYWGRIAGLVPEGMRQLMSNRKSVESARPPEDFPVELLTAVRHGLLAGPGLYARERWRLRHQDVPRLAESASSRWST